MVSKNSFEIEKKWNLLINLFYQDFVENNVAKHERKLLNQVTYTLLRKLQMFMNFFIIKTKCFLSISFYEYHNFKVLNAELGIED